MLFTQAALAVGTLRRVTFFLARCLNPALCALGVCSRGQVTRSGALVRRGLLQDTHSRECPSFLVRERPRHSKPTFHLPEHPPSCSSASKLA